MVQLVQQWLPTNRRSKNPVVIQSTGLDVSVGVQNMPESLKIRLQLDLLVRVRASRQKNSKFP